MAAPARLLLAIGLASSGLCAPQHHWPRARGSHDGYFLTEHRLPFNLAKAHAWNFTQPEGRYRTVMRGNPLIDSEKNVLILTEWALFKLDPNGNILWQYRQPYQLMNIVPCIEGGFVYGQGSSAVFFKLDLNTGHEIWAKPLGNRGSGFDTSYVDARNGIVLGGVDQHPHGGGGGNARVVAVNASDGELLWEYKLDLMTWNFNPLFVDESSFVFMDVWGGIHKVWHRNGTKIWYTLPPDEGRFSFTDGGLTVSPDGATIITCSNNLAGDTFGMLRKFSSDNGRLIWEKPLPTGCTSWPAISKDNTFGAIAMGPFVTEPFMTKLPRFVPTLLKVLFHEFVLWMGDDLRRLPIFAALHKEIHTAVMAFDPGTGDTLWSWRTPDWLRAAAKGDDEGLLTRGGGMCLPTTWSSPTIDGDGVVRVGHVSGTLYSLKDKDKDGRIGADEVDSFDIGGAPLPNNAAWAPGMMAFASCDTLHVFKG